MKCDYSRQRFEAIDVYALGRAQTRGDVYGWAPLEHEEELSALLLVSQDAMADSFPASISGIRLVLKRISAPEVHRQ